MGCSTPIFVFLVLETTQSQAGQHVFTVSVTKAKQKASMSTPGVIMSTAFRVTGHSRQDFW